MKVILSKHPQYEKVYCINVIKLIHFNRGSALTNGTGEPIYVYFPHSPTKIICVGNLKITFLSYIVRSTVCHIFPAYMSKINSISNQYIH